MNRALFKVIVSEVTKLVTIPLRLMPIKNNRILFTGLTGGNIYEYACNPKYLYEYMKSHCPGKYEYVWAVDDKKKYEFLKEEGVKMVKHFTISSFPLLLTSKVIVTNGSYAPWFPFRKEQYVINTWHGGGAYKKVENETPGADWATRKRAKFCADNIDLFLASCKMQEDNMIKRTYQYNGEILRAGTPRNDKLVVGDIDAMANKVREFYNIPTNGRIILFAPTYRKSSVPICVDSDKIIERLKKSTNIMELLNGDSVSEWVFMSRMHRYQKADGMVQVKGNHVINVFDYPDMQELLAVADILITDYSSCIWDYALLKRPCFLYVPDKKEYNEKTGFYVGIDEWPYSQAESMDELLVLIDEYDNEKSIEKIEQHLNDLGSYEHGNCCRELSERIAVVCDGMGK